MASAVIDFDCPEAKDRFIRRARGLRGRWQITAVRWRPTRSNRQNAYYHAAVVSRFREYLCDQGQQVTHDEAHNLLAMEILGRDVCRPDTGEILGRCRPSTRSLNTEQFNAFLERSIAWLAGFGIEIEDPRITPSFRSGR